MDENKNELNPLEEKNQPIIEDVFSDLPNMSSNEIVNDISQEETKTQYETADQSYQQNSEPKITTYEPKLEQVKATSQEKNPKKLLFILILGLILIVGSFVIWVIL